MTILARYCADAESTPQQFSELSLRGTPTLNVNGVDTVFFNKDPNFNRADQYEVVSNPLRPNTPGVNRSIKLIVPRPLAVRCELGWNVGMGTSAGQNWQFETGEERWITTSVYLSDGNDGLQEFRGPGIKPSGDGNEILFCQSGVLSHQISPGCPDQGKIGSPVFILGVEQAGLQTVNYLGQPRPFDIDQPITANNYPRWNLITNVKKDHFPGGQCKPVDDSLSDAERVVWGPDAPIGQNWDVWDMRGDWIDFVYHLMWHHNDGWVRVWMSHPRATNNQMIQIVNSDWYSNSNTGGTGGWGYRDHDGTRFKFFTQYWDAGSSGRERRDPFTGQEIGPQQSYCVWGRVGDEDENLQSMRAPVGTVGGGETVGLTIPIFMGRAGQGTRGVTRPIQMGRADPGGVENAEKAGIVRVFTSDGINDEAVRACIFPEIGEYTPEASRTGIVVVMTNRNNPGFVCGLGLSDGVDHYSVVGISANGAATPVTQRTLSSDQSLIHVPSDASFADIKFPAFAGFIEGGFQYDWTGQFTTQGNVLNHYWTHTGPNVLAKLVPLSGTVENGQIVTPQLWAEPVAPNFFVGFTSGQEFAIPGANLSNNLQFSLGFAAHDGSQIDQGQFYYSLENGGPNHVGRVDAGRFLARTNINNGLFRSNIRLDSVADGQATFTQLDADGTLDSEYYVLCMYLGDVQAKMGFSQLPTDTSDLEIGVGPAQSQLSIATHLTTLGDGTGVGTEDPSVGAFCISMASIDPVDTEGSVQLSASFLEEYQPVGNTNNSTRSTNALVMDVPDHQGNVDYTSDLVNNKSDGSGVRFSTVTGSATAGQVMWLTVGKSVCRIAGYSPGTVKAGDSITVTGIGFLPDPQAFYGATPLNTIVLGDDRLQVDIPPDVGGTEPLTVQTSAGTSSPIPLHVTGGKTYFFRGSA